MIFNSRCSVTPSLQLLFITSQCTQYAMQLMTVRLIRVDDFAMQNTHIQIWDCAVGHD